MTLLFVAPLCARTKTDTLVMNNGDRLTGEIKSLDAGILYVSFDYINGTSQVDWSKVNHLESKQFFIVRAEDGSVYSGMLNTTENAEGKRPMQLRISETAEGGVVIAQPEVINMTQTSIEFWKRFNGNINSGTTYSKGNETFQYQLNASVQYPRPRWSAGAGVNSTLSSSTGATVSTRNSTSVNFLHLLRWNNWFYTGLGNFLQSSTQNIDLQSNIGGGSGRYLKNTNRTTISVVGGVAWQNTRYSHAEGTQNVAAALLGTHIEFFKFDKTNLTAEAFAFPALSQPGRVFYTTNITYYIKLGHNITWNTSFFGNWDNQPPPHFTGSDYGSSSGIGWTFGNK